MEPIFQTELPVPHPDKSRCFKPPKKNLRQVFANVLYLDIEEMFLISGWQPCPLPNELPWLFSGHPNVEVRFSLPLTPYSGPLPEPQIVQ